MTQENGSFVYNVLGLLICSDSSIPGLTPSGAIASQPDLCIWWNSSPRQTGIDIAVEGRTTYVSPYLDESGNPALTISTYGYGDFRRLCYYDGTEFWVDGKNENIWITWRPSSSLNDAATYLLGPVLGFILRLRGIVCLHASAVMMAGLAVVIAGSEGTGKSTTAAALVQAGHTLISDDVVALFEKDGKFWVRSAYPYLALWPDSVNALFGSHDALPRFSNQWEKRRFGPDSGALKFENRDASLGAVYILAKRLPEPARRIEVVSVQTALLSLISHSYATNTLDAELRAREFEFLGRMVSFVPVRKLYPHPDPCNLHQIPKWIANDLQESQIKART
jgi:HPr Serine kinase C-terminal domain